MSHGTRTPQRALGAITTEVDGQPVVLLPAAHSYVELVGPAGSIWGLIDGRRTVDDLVAEFVKAYQLEGAILDGEGPDPGAIGSATIEMLETLETAGFICFLT